MKIVSKILNYIFIFTGLIIIYVVLATAISYIPVNKDQSSYENQDLTVYILTNGVHTDIAVPFRDRAFDWSRMLDPSLTPGGNPVAAWVSFGWGDRGFYLQTPEWKDLTLPVAFKAVTGLGKSAMHVTYYNRMIPGEDCVAIKLNQAQYKQLCAFITARFDLRNNRFQIIETDQNYGLNDVFYEARGSYNLFYTCNTWANNALKAAGLRASLFTLWDKGIFHQYQPKK